MWDRAPHPVTGVVQNRYKKMDVTVSWSRPRPAQVRLSSAVYGKSRLSEFGDLEVLTRNARTGEPIGAFVTVYRDGLVVRQGSTFTSTDPPGSIVFTGLEEGTVSITAAAPLFVFDDWELENVTVTPEVVTSVVARGYERRRASIVVKDQAGALVKNAKVRVTQTGGRQKENTGADGTVSFDDLVPGDYLVEFWQGSEKKYKVVAWVTIKEADVVYLVTVSEKATSKWDFIVDVTDSNGLDLDGATVTAVGSGLASGTVETVTSVNGRAVFDQLKEGSYRVTATLPGYASASADITMPRDAPLPLTLVPSGSGPDKGSLRIIVRNYMGSPVAGVSVRIVRPDNKLVTRGATRDPFQSGADGVIRLGNLVPGTYIVWPEGGTASTFTVVAGSETIAQVQVGMW